MRKDLTTGCGGHTLSPSPVVLAAGKVALRPSCPLERHARGRGQSWLVHATLHRRCQPPRSFSSHLTEGGGTENVLIIHKHIYKIRPRHRHSASPKRSKYHAGRPDKRLNKETTFSITITFLSAPRVKSCFQTFHKRYTCVTQKKLHNLSLLT